MAPRLHLSQSTQGKVTVAPPRINLRRAKSYNDRSSNGPLSSTSSRFNFNHLLFSPPPSPGLPALLPKRKRSTSGSLFPSRPSRIIRTIFCFILLSAACYSLVFIFRHRGAIQLAMPYANDPQYEMVGQDTFPDFPTPIIMEDAKGRSRWTVFIPRTYDFPLSIEEYKGMNGLCRKVSAQARDLYHKSPLSDQIWLSYDSPDEYFVDVREAENTGLLSLVSKGQAPKQFGHFVGLTKESMSGKRTCERSLTYVLESPSAGLGEAVMSLWTLYALAKEQGRAFFIDDSRWAYGTYSDLFQPPPVPSCRPPPRNQMLPCPSQTRHLVVSSVTIKDVLPALLAKHQRQGRTDLGAKDLFELAHRGYKSLFKLTPEDQSYVEKRIKDLKTKTKAHNNRPVDSPIIGFHIRHGDQHPFEYQYRQSYIPTEVFTRYGNSQVETYYQNTRVKPDQYHAVKVVASDDPTVHEEPEFINAFKAQEQIKLAKKKATQSKELDRHTIHGFVEEAFGWEGGFFEPIFWNLGRQPKKNALEEQPMKEDSDMTLKLRSLVGRAYMMDLAVLAGSSDKVVCAVSAMGCRLLGVMMGWERAMNNKDWVNVDGGLDWAGLIL